MAQEVITLDEPPITDEAHVPVAESHAVHKPFVPASRFLPEFTPRAIILGSILGIIFGASSVYLALRVGLTVSASIPIAVMSISIFRALGRASILENNIAQTTGSAGESVAAGIAFTIPALLVLGYDLEISRTTMVALLGGWLGVLLMIPLRRALIVKEHGKLLYPEGTACAEVLVVGEKGGTDAKLVFAGFGVAAVYRLLMSGARLWNETPAYVMRWYQGATASINITPDLLGVGYIIGARVAAMMVGGGILTALVLIPMVKFFGAGYTEPLFPVGAGGPLISSMNAGQVQDLYIRYIAAGAVATGGIISLVRSLPMIVGAFASSIGGFGASGKKKGQDAIPRTERDMPMTFVLGGILVLSVAIFIWLTVAGSAADTPKSGVLMNILSVVLVLVFGFFFATVSSRITGELGSSSNPISGMTIAAILMTSLIFLLLGMGGADSRVLALSVGAVVCIALSNAGTTSQDLKTGYLVGGTPSRMQWGLMVGVTTSALVIAWTLSYLNNAYTNLLPSYYPSYRAQVKQDDRQWAKGDLRGGQLAGGPFYVHRLSVEEKGSDGTVIPSGQYLTDALGEIHYRINPGVGGTRTAVTTENVPLAPLDMNAGVEIKGSARGLDDQIYRIAIVKGADATRTFYVDDKGQAKYEEVTTGAASKFDAPKGQLMAILVDGVLTQKLPWSLILIGAFIAILLEVVGIHALPFAVGMYLPIATSAAIFVGGLVRALVKRMTRERQTLAEEESGPGVLYSSGLIAGGTITGLLLTIPQSVGRGDMFSVVHFLPAWFEENRLTALVMFTLLAATLYYVGKNGLSRAKRK
ncbi:MAG TPA: oligopeptide transporter, OPT family [Pyrinomonadaceae bacterium]|jgi:putative OPT family oligopeptide transporter